MSSEREQALMSISIHERKIAALDEQLKVARENLQASYDAAYVGEALLAAAQQQLQERETPTVSAGKDRSIAEMTKALEILRGQVQERDQRIERLEHGVPALAEQIASLKAQLEEANTEVCKAQHSEAQSEWLLAEAKAEVERHKRWLAESDVEWHGKLTAADTALADSERQVSRLREALENMNSGEFSNYQIRELAKAALHPGCQTCGPSKHHLIGYHHGGPDGEACTVKDCGCTRYVKPEPQESE